MSKTVVGLFDRYASAERAAAALESQGFKVNDVSMVTSESTRDSSFGVEGDDEGRKSNNKRAAQRAGVGAGVGATVGGIAGLLVGVGAIAIPGVGPLVAAGPIAALLTGAGVGAAAGGIVGALTTLGVPEEHARYYEEGVRRGGTLVTVVAADDARAQTAAHVLTQYGALDVEQEAARWQTEVSDAERSFYNTDTSRAIPVIEEELEVGKREVEGRSVHVYSRIVETPVNEQVRLREERVHVERRPVDREVDPNAIDTFQETEVEMTERSEQAVVGKRARVVEEVRVAKDVEERVEEVSDTVRHTEVEVEEGKNRTRKGNVRVDTDSGFVPGG